MFGYQKTYKRILDLTIAIVLLVLLWPAILILILLLLVLNGNPVVFKQKRIGINNEPFMMYKFRTLMNKTYVNFSFCNDDYVRLGKILRKTGLDELPQLLNVLKGDMSIVGPRPLPVEYLNKIANHSRSTVRPGITGLVQTKGDNLLKWNTRFMLDKIYVRNVNFKSDLIIIFNTVLIPFVNRNIKGEQLMNGIHE